MTLISEATHLRMLKSSGAELITHATGEFWAIFKVDFEAVSGEVEVEQRVPTLFARTSDAEGLPKAAILTRAGKQYRVVRHEPDEDGETRLILSRA